MIASPLLGVLALASLIRGAGRGRCGRSRSARSSTVIGGWAIAQHPTCCPTSLTIDAGAGAGPALTAVIVVFVVALAMVGPALALLFWLAQREMLE